MFFEKIDWSHAATLLVFGILDDRYFANRVVLDRDDREGRTVAEVVRDGSIEAIGGIRGNCDQHNCILLQSGIVAAELFLVEVDCEQYHCDDYSSSSLRHPIEPPTANDAGAGVRPPTPVRGGDPRGGTTRAADQSLVDSLSFPVSDDYEECSADRGLWIPESAGPSRADRSLNQRSFRETQGGSEDAIRLLDGDDPGADGGGIVEAAGVEPASLAGAESPGVRANE